MTETMKETYAELREKLTDTNLLKHEILDIINEIENIENSNEFAEIINTEPNYTNQFGPMPEDTLREYNDICDELACTTDNRTRMELEDELYRIENSDEWEIVKLIYD